MIGAAMQIPLATMLQKANKEDLISAGNISLDEINVNEQQGQMPNLPIKTIKAVI